MKKALLYFICISTIVSCRSSKTGESQMYKDNIPIIKFCDLPKFKGQQVFVKGFYSGVDEYWSFNNGTNRCMENLSIDLQSEGDIGFVPPKKFEDIFQKVFDSYHDSYLEIEAIGKYENDRETGYGHLGTNKSRFVVSELISATLIKR